MVLDQVGGETFPATYTADGQKFVELQDSIGFILEKGVFRKAGKYCWKTKYSNGQLSMPGIGLNTTLYSLIEAKHEKQFYVYDRKADRYFHLNQRTQMKEHAAEYRQSGKKLKVVPLDLFQTVEDSEAPEELREYVRVKTGRGQTGRFY